MSLLVNDQHRTTRTVFRTVAVAEAVSWALLLCAMYAKWIAEAEPFGLREGGVPVAGMIHGVVFLLFVVLALVAWRQFGWGMRVLLLALVAAVVPFATYVFEVRADRHGLLGPQALQVTSA
ncbi:MAG: DUF3817 domain-containing protein [Aeromicrobium sp.]|uniref:DUF3817 domain-containing protein n=1 Tax=Aeromicrobium sp. TaxID=1871063 RepID=UPI003C353EAF